MMLYRLSLSAILLLPITYVRAQPAKDIDIIKQTIFIYADSVNGKTYLGDYQPTGAISCTDSSYIISTVFSINFPEQYDTTDLDNDFEKYYARTQLYEEKAHISSGSVFKLNKDLVKVWEVIFKDKRVTHIIPCDNSSFIVSGERIDQKVIWIAKISSTNGSILWLNEFKVGRTLSTCGLSTANGNFYILGETKRLVPLQIKQHYGKTKIELFRSNNFPSSLLLLCVSNKGHLKWKRKIDPKKKYNSFGNDFFSTKDRHFILSSFDGLAKVNGKRKTVRGNAFYTLNKKGKIQSKQVITMNDMLYTDSAILFTKTDIGSDHIITYRLNHSAILLTDSFPIPSERKDIRVLGALTTKDNYYIYGTMQENNKDFLVCHMSKDFRITEYLRHDQEDYNEIVSLLETSDNNLLLVGWSYKNNDATNHLYTCMNIIKIKKFGN